MKRNMKIKKMEKKLIEIKYLLELKKNIIS